MIIDTVGWLGPLGRFFTVKRMFILFLATLLLMAGLYYIESIPKKFFKKIMMYELEFKYALFFSLIFLSIFTSKLLVEGSIKGTKWLWNTGKNKLGYRVSMEAPSVWDHLMKLEETKWAYIRDFDKNHLYYGWISDYAEDTGIEEQDEIFLKKVKIWDLDTKEFLREVPSLYLARDRSNFLIEFPEVDPTQ